MDVKCATDLGIRKCNKYLGTFDLLVGVIRCKSCRQKNYYEVVTEVGLTRAKSL